MPIPSLAAVYALRKECKRCALKARRSWLICSRPFGDDPVRLPRAVPEGGGRLELFLRRQPARIAVSGSGLEQQGVWDVVQVDRPGLKAQIKTALTSGGSATRD